MESCVHGLEEFLVLRQQHLIFDSAAIYKVILKHLKTQMFWNSQKSCPQRPREYGESHISILNVLCLSWDLSQHNSTVWHCWSPSDEFNIIEATLTWKQCVLCIEEHTNTQLLVSFLILCWDEMRNWYHFTWKMTFKSLLSLTFCTSQHLDIW